MSSTKTAKDSTLNDASDEGNIVKIDGKNPDNQNMMDVSGLMALLDKTRSDPSDNENKISNISGSFSLESSPELKKAKAEKKAKKASKKKSKSKTASKKQEAKPEKEEEITAQAEKIIVCDEIIVESAPVEQISESAKSIANVEAAIIRNENPNATHHVRQTTTDSGIWPLVGVMVVICLGVFGITYVLDQKATEWAQQTASKEQSISIPAKTETVKTTYEAPEEEIVTSSANEELPTQLPAEELSSVNEEIVDSEVEDITVSEIEPSAGNSVNINTPKRLPETQRYELLQILKE